MKFMKSLNNKILVVILISSATFSAQAQTEPVKNSTYLEFGGNAAAYSLNYERHFAHDIGLRVGIGSLWIDNYTGFGIPVMLNKYWGNQSSNHKFETGIGTTIFTGGNNSSLFKNGYDNSFAAGTATLGYRYLPKSSGMTFKIAFTPIFREDFILPWLGFSVGYSS